MEENSWEDADELSHYPIGKGTILEYEIEISVKSAYSFCSVLSW